MKHRILFSGGDMKTRRLIKRCIAAALDSEGVTIPCEINVLLTNDEEIRTMNAHHRGKDSATDVLSFPTFQLIPGDSLSRHMIDPETGLFPLGDMAMSLERAKAQAAEFNHSPEREAGYLSVHSVLHLLGYDHEEEDDRRQMRGREDDIMAALKLFRE